MVDAAEPEGLYTYCEDCNEGREVFTAAEAEAWRQGHAQTTGHARLRVFQAGMLEGEESVRGKFFFLASMSHELRSLLNTIIGFSELLQETAKQALTERQQRHLGLISESGRHILRHVSDILDLARIEAGAMAHDPVPLAVGQALEDVLPVTRALAEKKGQALRAIVQDLPLIHADPVHFKQILFNLLTNAVKFTPEGGRITLRARTVMGQFGDQATRQLGEEPTPPSARLPSCPVAGWVEIAVQDTGIGIEEEDLPRLFREFSQLETTGGQRPEGSGLGLALTKRLVELHGGTIGVTSPGRGRGATFTVLLPTATAGTPEHRSGSTSGRRASS